MPHPAQLSAGTRTRLYCCDLEAGDRSLKMCEIGLKPKLLFTFVIWALTPCVSAEEISFNRDVRPLLSDRCFACHGPDEEDRQADLRLDVAEGEQGAYRTDLGTSVIKPGDVEQSELWHRITSDDPDTAMPPPEAKKSPLTEADREIIRKWIEAGAPYEDFWAFVPPKQPTMPAVKDAAWSDQPIDRFVLAQLERENLKPSEIASKRTLIRRVTFDLTGLPPTREEIHAFLADERPGAYERLVDHLLSREQYGEHMARYWLDLVRFADTNGMHKDFYRNFIAYRDWVIRAFNQNLGYDDFLRYQLAGDLYEKPTNDQLIATGFNRLHLIIDVGTALPEESFYKNVVDRVSAVGTTFLGLTVQCAQCHDHKYDPITQKDYYSLFAFFNNLNAKPETRNRPPNGLQPPFISLGTDDQAQELADLDDRLKQLNGELRALEGKAKEDKSLVAAAKELKQNRDKLKKERDRFDLSIPKAMVMKERAEVRETHIMNRGQYDSPGEKVVRDAPEFLLPLEKRGDVATRMDLANWFVDRRHPLTARVAVNRVWQQFFGVGLVKTSEDLGAQGEVPSHPKLLDYLAWAFMDSGWDIKALAKQIVMSQTYRQSSHASPESFERDPDNRRLARGSRFRLDAEMIRDQILATSGLLSKTLYGRSVKPPQPAGLWKAVTMTGERFKPDQGEQIYRRSLYTYWKRAMPPPQMTILNAPNRDACVARRERTNTPSQALLLLNESEYLKAAGHLARNVVAEAKSTDDRVKVAYETITGDLPDQRELRVLGQLAKDLQEMYVGAPELAKEVCDGLGLGSENDLELATWTVVMNTLYNLDVTKNKE